MGGFGSHLPTMQEASQHVLQVSQDIRSELSVLMGKLEGLEGKWEGGAKAKFDNLKQTWNDNANKLNIALEGIGSSLGEASHIYHSHDEDAVQDLNRVLTHVPYTNLH